MTSWQRWRKRLTILLVFVLVVGGLYLLGRGVIGALIGPPAPTCTDGIQNQNEEGVDCGGPCEACFLQTVDPISVEGARAFPADEGFASVMVELRNPNAHAGAAVVEYAVALRGTDGSIVGSTAGDAFLLPSEEQFFVLPRVSVTAPPITASAVIDSIQWQEFDRQPQVRLMIVNDRLDRVTTADGLDWRLRGEVRNASSFDLDRVIVSALLHDDNGAIIGVGRTEARTVRSEEERAFEIRFPAQAVAGTPVDTQIRAITNIFSNTNILLEYGAGEKQPFQRF